MQLDHTSCAGVLVQAVGVLRDDRREAAAASIAASAKWPGFGLAESATPPRSLATLQYEAGSARKLSIEDTLTGSYFVHRPPAPRNVGMPLSAETPAPVSATPRRAEARISAACSTVKRRSIASRRAGALRCTRPSRRRSAAAPTATSSFRGSRSR